VSETEAKANRPVSLTIICILGFLGALVTIPMIFSPVARLVGPWYPPYLGFAAATGLLCMIGLWKMKRWAAWTYTGLVALNQVVFLVMGVWNVLALAVPAVIIFFALRHAPEMT